MPIWTYAGLAQTLIRLVVAVGEGFLFSDHKHSEIDSKDTDYRYAAYASRARTILRSAHRYVAYTSDIGESFRPVAHPYLIRGAYAVSWGYLLGDVSYEGWKAYHRNQSTLRSMAGPTAPFSASDGKALQAAAPEPGSAAATLSASSLDEVNSPKPFIAPIDDYRTVMAQRAIFQSVASMGLPAFTIHSVVKYSGKGFKQASNRTIRTYGPIGLGLAIVPFLPFIFDRPVEEAVEWSFHKGFEMAGAPGRPEDSREKKEL